MIGRARQITRRLWLATFATAALMATGIAVAATAQFDFTITIDPVARTLIGEGSIALPPGKATTLTLASGFVAESMQLDGRTLPLGTAADRQTWRIDAGTDARVVSVRWSGTLAALDATMQHRDTLGNLRPASSVGGTFLPASANWHPVVDGMPASYRVTLLLPPGQRGLVPGRLLAETDDTSGYRAAFEFAQAIDGIDLMAGPYRSDERVITLAGDRSVRLRTYFTQALADLAPGYLDSVAGYLAQYDDRIGAYPYTEFSVVSSPTPTGFGMPTLTYLGADVLRLPFIRATSLGHEVLHNWWGNGVFPDHASGNWSEGLTTFMADYEYKRREGEAPARAMRLAWLRDFSALPATGDTPLAAFTSRTHGTSQIVGYNKAAMVFSMLRDLIGEAVFDQGLRTFWATQRFRVASWDDLRQAFEQASNRDLAPFFAQWIKRPGAPTLHIAEARREPTGKGWRVQVRIVQPLPSFAVSVPLRIRTELGEQMQSVDVRGLATTATLTVDARPLEIALDPDTRVMRRLAPGEAPPILRDVMVNAATALAVLAPDPAYDEAARQLADAIADQPPKPIRPDDDVPASPLIVIGTTARIAAWIEQHALPPIGATLPQRGNARVWLARGRAASIAFIEAADTATLQSLMRGLPHYGGQSWLVFENGKVVERGVWPATPMVFGFER